MVSQSGAAVIPDPAANLSPVLDQSIALERSIQHLPDVQRREARRAAVAQSQLLAVIRRPTDPAEAEGNATATAVSDWLLGDSRESVLRLCELRRELTNENLVILRLGEELRDIACRALVEPCAFRAFCVAKTFAVCPWTVVARLLAEAFTPDDEKKMLADEQAMFERDQIEGACAGMDADAAERQALLEPIVD